MPDTTDPRKRSPAPKRQRRSKPKFEVPAETGDPQSAGWAYREDAAPRVPAPEAAPLAVPETPIAAAAPAAAPPTVTEPVRDLPQSVPQTPLIVSAFCLVAAGLSMMTMVALIPVNLFARTLGAVRR